MATEIGGMPNGNHHNGYGGHDQNHYPYGSNANTNSSVTSQPSTQPQPPSGPAQPQSEISKDEVGWYFVEQYYTTLSRSPEKLYLFYNKRSQYVSGQETDKVAVCVGQRAINDKIKELDFQDCKVRVTNVDSQASDSNIVIQVIGELSNKSQPHKKFTQTFVLATQTNGYFVLNDIFRFLIDEEDEPEQEATAAEDIPQVSGTESGYQGPLPPADVQPKTVTSSAEPSTVDSNVKEINKVIEAKLGDQEVAEAAPTTAVNGDTPEEPTKTDEEPVAAAEPEPVPAAEAERPISAEEELQPEEPKDPEPTPIASPPKPAGSQPASAPKPAVPAAPMSWASRVAAANRVATPATPAAAPAGSTTARPALPAAKNATSAAPASSSTPSAAAAPPAAAAAVPAAPAAQRPDAPGSESQQDEWTSVGPSHNRQASKQTNNAQPEGPQHRGYIKNVLENVDADELKATLEKFGELSYFDVSRQKNCAFVDFKTVEGYKNAIATPIEIGDEKLFVEERRARIGGAPPYAQRGQFQGGRGGRGGAGGQGGAPRGNFQGNRGGSGAGGPRGGRGGFAPAQRGGSGRGGSVAQA